MEALKHFSRTKVTKRSIKSVKDSVELQLEDIRGKTIGVFFLATISTIKQLSLNFWCYLQKHHPCIPKMASIGWPKGTTSLPVSHIRSLNKHGD
jgi:hypothetical protein